MEYKKFVNLSVFIISIIVISCVAFAQDAPAPAVDSSVTIPNQQPDLGQEKNDMQWAWGEITNLDNQAKTFTIKYLDYESDSEKEIILVVDESTVFENIKGLDELKLKDTLSIDYMIGVDNKNIAKNISLEKPDALEIVPAQIKEADNLTTVSTPAVPVVLENEIEAPKSDSTLVTESAPAIEPVLESSSTTEPASAPTPEVSVQE